MTCTQPGCGGTVRDGYCDTCGLAPASPAAVPAAPGPQPAGHGPILGCEPNTRAPRFGLERSYRALARLTRDEDRRIELVDMAGAIRPRTLT